jgi:hypothetical protein
MADRLRLLGRRMADFGSALVEAFVRDNRVLPPVLAVLALFVIAWILAGAFMNEPDQKTVAHKADLAQADLAQSDGGESDSDPAPGVENRDVNSYAAYRSKDPFREILAPEDTTPGQTTPETTTGPGPTPGGPGDGNATRDRDGDGVPDRRERRLGSDPNNPDTDRDGTPDGSDDDSNGDDRPDTGGTGAGSGTTPGADQPGRGGDRGNGDNDDGLLNSGGILPLP